MRILRRGRHSASVADYQRKKDLADLIRDVLVSHDRQRDFDAARLKAEKRAAKGAKRGRGSDAREASSGADGHGGWC